KVFGGAIEPRYFSGRGKKRRGKPSGHRFGKELLGIVEARRQIYTPAYVWMLENRVDSAVLEGFIARAFEGVTQYVHDVEDNGDIGKDRPWAHAALLASYLNGKCAERAAAAE